MGALKQEPQAVTFNGHLSSNALLTKIDALRELNLGAHEIGLPQLVVVGDQSSGKSSLLESLTGIPFPRGQNLCTRYATQITSRRDNISSISVDIIPGPRATDEHKLRLSEFKSPSMDPEDFKAKFPVVLRLVNEAMDIVTDPSLASGTIFSRDVLRVTITGPQADYLTIIDVPGIFRNTTGPITEEDIALVRDMVTGYITNSRTVILAVIPANVDIATQEILSLAKKQDPLGRRTLAILTKADTILEPSAQKTVCDLVAGRRPGLELGYHLVRNRGADDNDPIESGKLDRFFQGSPWNKLPPGSVGIHQLRLRLGKLLEKLTAGEFPKVKTEIMAMLQKTRKDLETLGAPRTTDIERRHMLQTVAGEFVGITINATKAEYGHWVGFDDERTRLITRLMDVKDKFGEVLLKNGHTWEFEGDIDLSEDYGKEGGRDNNSHASVASGINRPVTNSYSINSLIAKLEASLPWVADKLDDIEPITPPSPDILSAIRDINSRSYGRNITGISPGVLTAVFIHQSQKWSEIARIFVAHAIYHVHEFITLVCRSITEHDQILGERILDALEEGLRTRYQKAFKHAEFLEQIERRCELQTLNKEFHKQRKTHAVKEYVKTIFSEVNPKENLTMDGLENIIKRSEHSPEKEIYHRLEPYYHITVRGFMDNVWKQAVEWFLVISKDSPLGLFTQEWVSALDSETLAVIAAEDDEVKTQRELLTRKIEDLEKAAKILRS